MGLDPSPPPLHYSLVGFVAPSLSLSLSFTHTLSLSLFHTHTHSLSLSLSLSLRARVLCARVSLASVLSSSWPWFHFHKSFSFFTYQSIFAYGVATISRRLKIIGLFCKRALKNRRYSVKETYNFQEPTNRGHPISVYFRISTSLWTLLQSLL